MRLNSKAVALFGQGLSLAVAVVAAIVAGQWVDEKLGTSPLVLMLLLLGALYGCVRRLLWLLKTNSRAN